MNELNKLLKLYSEIFNTTDKKRHEEIRKECGIIVPKIEYALKLEELVKEDIKYWEDDPDFDKEYLTQHVPEYVNLVNMVSKSKK